MYAGQTQLHYVASTTLVICRKHANAKIAKNSEPDAELQQVTNR